MDDELADAFEERYYFVIFRDKFEEEDGRGGDKLVEKPSIDVAQVVIKHICAALSAGLLRVLGNASLAEQIRGGAAARAITRHAFPNHLCLSRDHVCVRHAGQGGRTWEGVHVGKRETNAGVHWDVQPHALFQCARARGE